MTENHLDASKDWSMRHNHGGSDDMEYEFAHLWHKHPNQTMYDCARSVRRHNGVRSTTFTMRSKANSSGDREINIVDL